MANSPSWRVESLSDCGLKKPGMAVPKTATVDDQCQERDGVVGPALGQDLADQVVGNVDCSAGWQPVRVKRHGALAIEEMRLHAGREQAAGEAGRSRAVDVAAYFAAACSAFRSQQVSGLRSALVVAFSSV